MEVLIGMAAWFLGIPVTFAILGELWKKDDFEDEVSWVLSRGFTSILWPAFVAGFILFKLLLQLPYFLTKRSIYFFRKKGV